MTRTLPLRVVLTLALCACSAPAPGGGAPSTAQRAKKKKKTQPEPSLKEARANSTTGALLGTPMLAGVLLRVYRRSVTTGVIHVREERLLDLASADDLHSRLRGQGWRRWPPPPAPELASALALASPELAECPFLLEVSEEPERPTQAPPTVVTCFATVAEIEVALARESLLQHRHAQVLPCFELKGRSKRDDDQRLTELRVHCAAMGVEFESVEAREASRAVKRRNERNRTLTRRIRK